MEGALAKLGEGPDALSLHVPGPEERRRRSRTAGLASVGPVGLQKVPVRSVSGLFRYACWGAPAPQTPRLGGCCPLDPLRIMRSSGPQTPRKIGIGPMRSYCDVLRGAVSSAGREWVHPVQRDETNAMAITGTAEESTEVTENPPEAIRQVHTKYAIYL